MIKKESRALKIVSNIGFTIFMIIMAVLIFLTAQSKLSGTEPSILGRRLYIVDSGSMEPALPINSLIIVKEKSADQIKVGDILTYYGSDSNVRVTHRVIEVGPSNNYFKTKGDANNVEDAIPVDRKSVIGTIALTIPYVGYVFRFLSTSLGIITILAIGIISFVLPFVFKRQPKEA